VRDSNNYFRQNSSSRERLPRRVAIMAGAGEKTSETVIQKIFDELPVP
jgi:hypothetical protein